MEAIVIVIVVLGASEALPPIDGHFLKARPLGEHLRKPMHDRDVTGPASKLLLVPLAPGKFEPVAPPEVEMNGFSGLVFSPSTLFGL